MNHINIIGYGYVGSGMGYLCTQNNVKFATCDVAKKEENNAIANFDDIQDIIDFSEKSNRVNYYVIAVPTPPQLSGACDTSIVNNVINMLASKCKKQTYIVIKSTVQPGTCRELSDRYSRHNFKIVFFPEFLREKTYKEDIYNAPFSLLGYPEPNVSQDDQEQMNYFIQRLYNHNNNVKVFHKKYEECEMFKYTINVFLSVKVWYFNEINVICDKLNIDYNSLHDLFELEPRIGSSHTNVPGHDGQYGFGGKCLPKETKGMCFLQELLGIDNTVLTNILKRNSFHRSEE